MNSLKKLKEIYSILYKYKLYVFVFLVIVLSIISIILQEISRNKVVRINSSDIIGVEGKMVVYVTGEVKNPGVYYINHNSRLNDVIDICGGLTENADIDKLNLAKKISDSEKIIIPKKNDEIIYFEEYEEETKVNINEANLEELKQIPSIGDITAKRIIEYRQRNKFNNIEDIMNVNGIGRSKFDTIKEYICVD